MFCNLRHTSMVLLPYNPDDRNHRFGLLPFRSPLLRESREWYSIRTNITFARNTTRSCFIFLSVLRCFTSRGTLPFDESKRYPLEVDEFPHSETSGSKAINRLPEAYRWLITSFIATLSLGIHRAPFMFPVRKPEHHNHFFCNFLPYKNVPVFIRFLTLRIHLSKVSCIFDRTRKPPRGGFLARQKARGYPLRLEWNFKFVYT